MTVFHVRNKIQSWYGESIGILILDAAYPCVPGNVGNASTFDFPVRYKVVKNASINRLLNERDPSLLVPFMEAARELQDEGVKAVTGACGFMALFQRQVADVLDIPVFLSSLLQVPFIYQMLPKGRKIGVISADSSALTIDHFSSVGITPDIPLILGGMENQKEFREAVLLEKGTLDSDQIQHEVVDVAKEMVCRDPDIAAILLECSDLPPYAAAVQAAVNRPVFDFITMIQYVHSALVRRQFQGFM
ncbi:aspartate/glutamate racemase family protein [Desulforhopalus sp. IMCC35007]|uniref:aspartate/glutamate racemase family protein n=1 Tax=Desulforhopalus sp. IMCC35007 TaxID=2569543 RepID=UPI0010ADD3E8|nr:aspartate/glutamate racemase family protein [Desulforhopalus sp. IMCC35007]TKB05706.1 aspartate/glutamate racemase family protein [Desulforhopalus sp. IMCC35007]